MLFILIFILLIYFAYPVFYIAAKNAAESVPPTVLAEQAPVLVVVVLVVVEVVVVVVEVE